MQYFFFVLLNTFFMYFLILNHEKIKKIYNVFDLPNSRKLHKAPISLLGGVYIFTFILFYFFSFIFFFSLENFINMYLFFSLKDLFFFFVILSFLFLIGILDDKFGIVSFKRIFLYFFLIYVYVFQNSLSEINNIYINNILYFKFFKFSKFLSILIFMIFLVSMNLYDGFNGQTASFYLLSFLIFSIILKSSLFFLIFLIPLLFFLYLNLKNKTFLGEGGVNILSFFYIAVIIKIYNLKIISNFDINSIFVIFAIPFLDAARLFIVRTFVHGNPLRADQNHIHHRLLKAYGNTWSLFLLNLPLFFIFFIVLLNINSFFVVFICLVYYAILFFKTKSL